MSIKAKVFVLTAFLPIMMISQSFSSQNIRVISDISAESTNLEVKNGGSKTSLKLDLPAISINDISIGGNNYKKIDFPTGKFISVSELAEDGKPDLPALTTNIIIPDQAGIRLTVTYSGYDDLPNIDLAPVQPSPQESANLSPVPFTIDQQTYSTDAFYPGNLAEASEPQIMRDIRFAQIVLYPAQYNPVQRVLRVYRDVSVDINYDGDIINPKTIHHRYISDGFYPIYKAMFANFEEVMTNVEMRRGGYVIICKPSLADSVRAVAKWKHEKGYPVRIVPTTEINSNGSPTKDQIFNFLRNAYAAWEVPPEYVMIVGDRDHTFIVPDYPYVGAQTYASDNKYACVDGTDYIPDIFVARMSVDNMPQAMVALSKILKYEKYPLMRDPQHWIRGLSVAYTYYESARLTTLWVRQLQLRNGFAQVDTVFDDGSRLRSLFNSGLGFIQYRGAGGTDGWVGPTMSISDLLALQNNQKLGVLSPLTCGTGDFGGECFGETWIRMGLNPDSLKGGPAFYGVSDHDTHTRWNNPIMVGYFFGMFEENIYHFAAAAVRGKLQDYWTFPRNIGPRGMVEQYFNTYNMLGDPELELRTKIPTLLNVTHPDTLALGTNNISVSVIDTAGNAISGAFVTLIKITNNIEEVFSLGKTDESGNVLLSFDAVTPGSMKLTVSGQNLYPYQSNIEIVTSDLAIGLDSTFIDDDTEGYSRGDGNHAAASGETIEFNVWIKNFGTNMSATNVTALLESIDDASVIYDGIRDYGNLAPGESGTSQTPFVINILPDAFDGQIARQRLTLRDQDNNSWQTIIEIPIRAPKFIVTRAIIPEGDSLMNPGETVNLKIVLSNNGSLNAQGVTGIVTTDDDYTNVAGSIANFGDISISGSGENSNSLISITCDSSAFRGRNISLVLHTSTMTGSKSSIPFTLPVGRVTQRDPVGTDAYGYYMYDRMDSAYAMMPTYQWVEISPDSSGGQGTRLNYGSRLDDNSVLITLPFNMVYYGDSYGAMIVCINGFAALDTFRMDMGGNYWANFFNWPIPDPGNARGQISPFWDDLRIGGSHVGVYKWYDAVNHKFYIEWLNLTNTNTNALETFQMVITDPAYYPTLTGDSEILFIYRDVNNTDLGEGYSSVGFESYDEQRGLEFTHDNFYAPGGATLIDRSTILITTNTGRGAIKGAVDLDNNGRNGGALIHLSAGQRRTTSDDGQFYLKEVPSGTVNLTAEALGYFPISQDNILVTANQPVQLETIQLSRCPVPSNLSASDNLSNLIEVRWDTLTNPNFAGFNIYRGRWTNGEFAKLNESPIQATSYSDGALADTNLYWYYVSALFSEGDLIAESFGSNTDAGKALNITGMNDEIATPRNFFLSQNYPNPFNPSTTISYGIPNESDVKIIVFNIIGQRVKNLVDQKQTAGYKQVIWDGKDESGRKVSSGLYFYRIETANFTKTNKMLLLK